MTKPLAGVLVATILAIAPSTALANTIHVSTSGTDAAGCGTGANPACATIQGALDASPAASGDTIQVAAGTYDETSTLTIDKSGVTIDGAGDGSSGATTITVPSNTTPLSADPANNYALVFMGTAGAGSTIENLIVNGNDDGDLGMAGGGNEPFKGIDILDAAGTVQNVRITNVENTPFAGGQNSGNGLQDRNDDGTSRTLTVSGVRVDHYNKTGMVFDGNSQPGLTVNVTNSTVQGAGQVPNIAQNGIEYLSGASGSVTGTTVTGNECDSALCGPNAFVGDTQGEGLIFYQTGPVAVSGSTVSGNDSGIFYGYPMSGTATISNDVFSANRYENLDLNQGTTNVSGSDISGSNVGVEVDSYTMPSPDPGNAIVSLTGNTISDNVTGIQTDDDATTSPSVFPVITAHNNVISNNTAGFANNVHEPQDAIQNYWGCPAGPGHSGCDGPTGIGASQVSVDPFITDQSPFPPGVQIAFGAPSIPVGGKTSLTLTIVNPNLGTSLSGIGLTDSLPAGLKVASPNGLAGSCGSGTVTAVPGSSKVSLSGGTLPAGSSCSFSATVTGTTTGHKTDTTGAASSTEGGSGRTASAAITVLGRPTVSIVYPRRHAKYKVGQVVPASYSCAEAAGGPGIASCSGTVANGSAIDTAHTGAHTFTVTATSSDGLSATRSVKYSVVKGSSTPPSNQFTVSELRVRHNGTVSFNVIVPGSGTIDVLESAANRNRTPTHGARRARAGTGTLVPAPGRFVFARAHLAFGRAETLNVTVRPNAEGRRLLRHHRGAVRIRLWVTYQPTGGRPRSAGYLGLFVTR